jgi:cyclophilin family peptidyl-prolyl cis-trans isomerase
VAAQTHQLQLGLKQPENSKDSAIMKKLFILCLLLLTPAASFAKDPEVLFRTSHGDFTVRLFVETAPLTVANFLAYVENGHYKGTIFHRVIPQFMIQCGGFNQRMEQKPVLDPVKNEAQNRLHNERGTLAMARTNDPDSATAQFFVNLRNNFRLDWTPREPGYTVFGEVIDGMFTIDSIALEQTGDFIGHQDVPLEPITILDAVLLAEGETAASKKTIRLQ